MYSNSCRIRGSLSWYECRLVSVAFAYLVRRNAITLLSSYRLSFRFEWCGSRHRSLERALLLFIFGIMFRLMYVCVRAHARVCVRSRDFDVIPRDSRDFPETTKQGKIEWLTSYCYVSDYWIPGNETLYELNIRVVLFPAVLRGLSTYIAIARDAGLDRLFTTALVLVIYRIP